MILVRTEFQCEAGRANEIVDGFKAMSSRLNDQDVIKRSRIMTDLSGTFDTVVVESEIESIDAYLDMLQATFADPEQAAAANMAYQTGGRTFYKIEATYEQDA